MKENIKEVNSIFEQPWWLDAVAPDAWDCAIVKEGDAIVARWPYAKKRVLGFRIYGNPCCTQTLGPWISCTVTNKVKALAKRKELYEKLISQLPQKGNVDLYMDSSVEFFLPFHWAGFRIEPTLSYRFDDLTDLDVIFKGIKDSRRTVIKNAAKTLTVTESEDVDLLIKMQEKTFSRQKRSLPIPEDVIRRLDEACKDHDARFMLVASDNEGNIHAASYFVYDSNVCYYIMSGADTDFRNSGAGSLLIWEGIKKAATLSKAFDFEGSNIADIELNFRTFGAPFVVNYRVSRLNFFLEIMDYMKPQIKKIIGYKQ